MQMGVEDGARKRKAEEEEPRQEGGDEESGDDAAMGSVEVEELWEDVIDCEQEGEMMKRIEAVRAEEEDTSSDLDWAWDDVHDKPLNVDKVRESRREEVQYMVDRHLGGGGRWWVLEGHGTSAGDGEVGGHEQGNRGEAQHPQQIGGPGLQSERGKGS